MSTLNLIITGNPGAGGESQVTMTVTNGIMDIWIVDYEIRNSNGRGRPSWGKRQFLALTYEQAKQEAEYMRECTKSYRNIDIKHRPLFI